MRYVVRIIWWYGAEVVLYISGVGFCVTRFDRQENAKASEHEASNSAGLHAFLCLTGRGGHSGVMMPKTVGEIIYK